MKTLWFIDDLTQSETEVSEATLQQVADVWYDGNVTDLARALLCVYIGGLGLIQEPLFGSMQLAIKGKDDGTLPRWAERTFLRTPALWQTGACAVKRNDDLGFLKNTPEGIAFVEGNMFLDAHAEGQIVTDEQILHLHDAGWRVD